MTDKKPITESNSSATSEPNRRSTAELIAWPKRYAMFLTNDMREDKYGKWVKFSDLEAFSANVREHALEEAVAIAETEPTIESIVKLLYQLKDRK